MFLVVSSLYHGASRVHSAFGAEGRSWGIDWKGVGIEFSGCAILR